MTEITEGAYLRVWPKERPGPSDVAIALEEPRYSESMGGETVVPVRYLGGRHPGLADVFAVTHVEVIKPGSTGAGQCGYLGHPIVVGGPGLSRTCPCGQTVDVPRPSLPEARASRDAAVEQVEANADRDWLNKALDAVRHVARTQPDGFIGDDVWTALAGLHPDLPAPREPRAMGAVMRTAVKERIVHLKECTVCGTTKVMTTGRSRASHAGDVPVYVAGGRTSLDRARAAQQALEDALDRRKADATAAQADGFTYAQIGAAMGLSTSNVHSLINGKKPK